MSGESVITNGSVWNSTSAIPLYYYDGYGENGSEYTYDYETYQMGQSVTFYTLPVLIIVGVLGNAASLHIIYTSPLRKYSVFVYICAFCISNLLSLLFHTGIEWFVIISTDHHFSHNSGPLCRIWHLFYLLVHYSGVWFVVAMAGDRFVTVWYPHKHKEWCTKFIAKLTVCVILVGHLCVAIHALWSYQIDNGICNMGDDLHTQIWSLVMFFCYSLVPIAMIFIFGNLVCIRLCLKNSLDEKKSAEVTHAAIITCCFYFFLNIPVIIIFLLMNLGDGGASLQKGYEIATHMERLARTTTFPILFVCCQEFRTSLYRKFSCCRKKKRSMRLESTSV